MSGKNKKKKKRLILKLNMGDTVKLSKGRIGLIRFIGKTQFGLGEWIGIELYNEILRTRHNGAVLGKRYFRCPPHRGVFVRRSLIKENIAVLDIPKFISKLRIKEKKLKDERKKKLKKEKTSKKLKNEEKRQAKRLKVQAKYANSPKPKYDTTEKIKTPKSDQIQTEKIDKITRKKEKEKPQKYTPALPASFKMNSRRNFKEKRSSIKEKRKSKKNKKRESNSKKRYSNSNSSKKGYLIDDNDSENAFDEFPKISTKVNKISGKNGKKEQKIKSFTRSKKSKSIESKKKKRNSSSGSSEKLPKSPVLKTSVSSPSPQVLSPFTPPQIDDDDSLMELEDVSIDSITPITRYSLSSNQSKSIDNIDDTDIMNKQTQTQPQAQVMVPLSLKSKVSVHSYDGVLDSDEGSLNESEDDEKEDSVLMKELEEDFENNYEKFHTQVLDDYTHTIDDIETGRKKLADKLVKDRKKKKLKSKEKREKKREKRRNRRSKGVAYAQQKMQERMITERRPLSPRINPTLMMAAMMNKRKQFHSARSRRGSSFVDEYNLNDTLFFDGDEETDTVQNSQEFYVDEMVSDDDDDESPTIEEEKKDESIVSPVEGEEDEYSMTETETDVDPLLGTIDEDEEEMKIFDIEKDDENEKVLVFYEKLGKFLVWESGENGNGMKINKINENDYGNALFSETGINTEWEICIINDDNISEMGRMYIGIRIRQCDRNVMNGYSLTFRKNRHDINQANNLKPSVYMKTKKSK